MTAENFTALAAAAAALLSVAATYTDLRRRMIPDWLNYSALALAVVVAYWVGALGIAYVALVALSFAFAYALYRLGAWAGGDVKFFTALMAYYPLLAAAPSDAIGVALPIVLSFLCSAALLVPVLLTVHLQSVWKERTHFRKAFQGSAWRALRGAPLAAAVAVFVTKAGSIELGVVAGALLLLLAPPFWLSIVMAAGALFWDFQLALPALGMALLVLWFVASAQAAFGILAKRVLRHPVPVSELEEGRYRRRQCTWKPGK